MGARTAITRQTCQNQSATRNQLENITPRKLSKSGEQILRWLEDAETCFPVEKFDELEDRLRILTSDLLKCATAKELSDIGDASSEFARKHPHGARILNLLEPLVFAHAGASLAWQLAPWKIKNGLLTLDEIWQYGLIAGGTGVPWHFRILDQPLPAVRRTDLRTFSSQIVKESSRWHLPKAFIDYDHEPPPIPPRE